MGNVQSEEILDSVKNPRAKRFVRLLLNGDIIESDVPSSKVQLSIKSKQQQKEDILREVISCINAQNQSKLTFGLCISERIINEKAIRLFSKAIEDDKALTILSFVYCEFTSLECINQLGMAIKQSAIASLNLSHTNLSQTFESLIQSLHNNTNIAELFLDSTNITNENIPCLCELLKSTKTLRIIDLTNNNIQEDGIKSLINATESNIFITDLRIKDNPGATNEYLAKLFHLLVRNKSVVRVIDKIIKQTFIKLTLKRRVAQTAVMLGRSDRAHASDSDLLSNQRSDQREVTRGRARGGTIDMSVVPTHIINATSAEEPLEDCGNSPSLRFQIGSSHTRGRRKDMQDAILIQGRFNDNPNDDLFCIFDGHGSQDSAIFVAKNLPNILKSKLNSGTNEISSICETFYEIDELLRPVAIHHGTTAVICLIRDNVLYTANVGDSRAVLCRNKQAIRLTVDHKPELPGETKRIERMGGAIRNNRVQGSLAVTRSFGDYFAGELVSSEPYITVTQLNKSDDYLLIACDGLFDIFMDDVAVTIANGFSDPQDAAVKLKDQAFISGSTDNISVIIVKFNNTFSSIDPSPDHDPVIERGLWLSSSDESEDSAIEEEDEEEEEEDEEEVEQEQNDDEDDDNKNDHQITDAKTDDQPNNPTGPGNDHEKND